MTQSLMRLHIATADPEEAHAWLRSAYADHTARLSGNQDGFRFSQQAADLGPLKAGVARHTMTLHGEWEPLDGLLLFSHLLHGRFAIRSSRAEVVAGPGDVFAYDPDRRMSVEWSDIRMAQIRLDRAAAARIAAELVGDDRPHGPLVFDLARPLTSTREQGWKRLMDYLARDVAASPATHGSPLVMRQVLRLVVATALETFPNTAAGHPDTPTTAAPPAAVRRAVAFIEEFAGTDIELTDVAAAAHVGPRALQRGFRRTLDTTPLAFLRSVRLRRAHDELRAAAPASQTVAAVAARWGFGHPGRFAAEYQSRFGCRPSTTLRG